MNRRIKICHDVFSVVYVYAMPKNNPWGILHKYKEGNQLGSIQTFYHELWRKE